jgi:FlaG/FlaF family flagellin (archaellin)
MAEVIERESGAASSFIWAIAMIVVVAILAAVVWYSGILTRSKKTQVDINVNPPAQTK